MMADYPALDPYAVRLERFELFSTNQCYYLVGCNKMNTSYRVLKMDRTLIERPPEPIIANKSSGGLSSRRQAASQSSHSVTGGDTASSVGNSSIGNTSSQMGSSESQTALADNSHTAKPTLRPLTDFLSEDPNVYTQEEIKDMLDMINDGNRMSLPKRGQGSGSQQGAAGGLKPIITKAYGVVGFIRFLDCYHLTLITRRSKVGAIGGNSIYTIKSTETIALKPAEQMLPGSDDHADPSSVLLSMWNRGKRSVGLGLTNREIAELRYQGLYQVIDLTKNFFFSYTYELTRSLQENFLATKTKPCPPPPFKEMYAWNYFLTREFESCLNSFTSFHWMLPIVHGAFVQRRVNDYGRSLNLILMARRSRHFAGTRYLKRGVSEEGKVANDVEHEQIVHDDTNSSAGGIYSSYLQVRGSIPTFWTQESSVTMPKPPIELNRVDPTYTATQLHFEDLMKRYSSPIIVLDLVKQSEKREREVRVGNEYRHAIDYINTTIDESHKIRYCALDYSHISKHRHLDVSASLNEVSTWAVNQTGFFCSAPKWKIREGGIIEPFAEQDAAAASRLAEHLGVPVFPMEQSGILRTNCIDCLDRTNVGQFSAGVEAIGQQLVVMGVRSRAKLDPSSNIVRVLIDMYVDIGDSVALQYGGSEAHKKVTADRSESNISGPIGKHKELLTSIRRYYSNAFTDRLKQDAMNLFLGYYLPYSHSIPLWEMETDYYLHNFHVKAGRGTMYSMKTYQRAFGIDWQDDDDSDYASTASTPLKTGRHQAKPLLQREESQSVKRVRSRCRSQNELLSTWWKGALQSNIKQRMWMQIGVNQSESLLPPQFERLYQPDKLGQFDRFFSRGWATPSRRSHAAQHNDGPDSDDASSLLRVVSEDFTQPPPRAMADLHDEDNSDVTMSSFLGQTGFEPRPEPSLKSLLRLQGANHHHVDPTFLGNINSSTEAPRPEYLKYVGPLGGNSRSAHAYAPERIEEFKSCLHDYTMTSDDVSGIHALAQSAHIGSTILQGPYRGLQKDRSAVEVATAITEQFHAFESLQSGGRKLVERELQRRGFDTDGVKESVASGWTDFKTSERQYTEVVEGAMDQWRRSDLSTADSLKLYTSMFDGSTVMSTADQIFLNGRSPTRGEKPKGSSLRQAQPLPRQKAFIDSANRVGINVTPYEQTSSFAPLFQCERRRNVPEGFEQINEDMFARKDNKFMVFNGPGMKMWNGTQPVTKISTPLLTTLSH